MHNSGRVRSAARYVISANSTATAGAGIAQELILTARFDKGALNFLQWYDKGCGTCGGSSSQLCLEGRDCAAPLEDCTASRAEDLGRSLSECSTAINVVFAGTDRDDQALKTASNVKRLGSSSLENLLASGAARIPKYPRYTYENITRSWEDVISAAPPFTSAVQPAPVYASG